MMQSSQDCSRTLLHVTGLSSSYWFIFHCLNPGLACEYRASPLLVCASPSESVAASWGGAKQTVRVVVTSVIIITKGYKFGLYSAVKTSQSSQGVI